MSKNAIVVRNIYKTDIGRERKEQVKKLILKGIRRNIQLKKKM